MTESQQNSEQNLQQEVDSNVDSNVVSNADSGGAPKTASDVQRPDSPHDPPVLEAGSLQLIVAYAGPRYRVPRYIMILLFLLFAFLFIKDGFFTYPREQEENNRYFSIDKKPPHEIHTDMDIRLQKILGIALIPLAAIALGFVLYRSRGAYRLEGQMLSVPSHPPIDIGQLVRIDRRLWDRKGIADVYYVDPEGKERRIRLDDFVYQLDPTDAIFERIQKSFEDANPRE